jgi:hypothetical protein
VIFKMLELSLVEICPVSFVPPVTIPPGGPGGHSRSPFRTRSIARSRWSLPTTWLPVS